MYRNLNMYVFEKVNKKLFQSINFSMSPCLHVSMSPCLCIHISMSPCLHVNVSMFPEFHKQKTELIENATSIFCCKRKMETTDFCLFAASGNRTGKFVCLGQQTRNGNRRLLFEQRAYLCQLNIDRAPLKPLLNFWSVKPRSQVQ